MRVWKQKKYSRAEFRTEEGEGLVIVVCCAAVRTVVLQTLERLDASRARPAVPATGEAVLNGVGQAELAQVSVLRDGHQPRVLPLRRHLEPPPPELLDHLPDLAAGQPSDALAVPVIGVTVRALCGPGGQV